VGKVYSYLRFSDPKQATGSSIDRQAAYAKKWAAEHGLELDQSLSLRDEGLSAYHQRHVKTGALGAFLAAAEEGRILPGSVLIVEGYDRLSRAEPLDALAQLTRIVNVGITVVTASDGKAYNRETLKANPTDLLFTLMVMTRAFEESDTKSKRVNAAFERQCKAWQAGTFRGFVSVGKDPSWLRRKPDALQAGPEAWELVPERVAAVQHAMQRYVEGMGADQILAEMAELGLRPTDGPLQRLQIYRIKDQAGLIGTKAVKINGQAFELAGYYPTVIDQALWDDIQLASRDRFRRRTPAELPAVLTGLGITVCGYCGQAMVGQNINNRKKMADGRYQPGHRRLRCTSWLNNTEGCPAGGSVSVVPIETALMSYCSDMINLRSLYAGSDRAGQIRTTLASKRARAAELDKQLARLMDVLLSTDQAPETVMTKMRTIETDATAVRSDITTLEAELAGAARHNLDGADKRWAELAHGVEFLDPDARRKARQLVADTFERIVIWHHGIRLSKQPRAEKLIDVMLVPKGSDTGRLLRINKLGKWVAGEDVVQA
jgi:hypothetical protein